MLPLARGVARRHDRELVFADHEHVFGRRHRHDRLDGERHARHQRYVGYRAGVYSLRSTIVLHVRVLVKKLADTVACEVRVELEPTGISGGSGK